MRYLLLGILLPAICFAQSDLEFDDPFEGMDPPILDFDKPKTEPRKVNPITDDDYCLCRCMKTTDVKSRTRFFKGKRDGKACLCECLVK